MYDDNQQSGYNASQQNSANQPGYQSPPPQYQQQQYQSPQPQYQPSSQPQSYSNTQQWPPMKIGDWAIVWLISLIPIVNLVMMFVWGFGSDVNPSKKAYFQWQLIIAAVGIVLSIILFVVAGAFFATLFSSLANAL